MLDPKLVMMLAVATLLLVNGIIDMGRRRALGRHERAWDVADDGPPEGRASVPVDEGL